MKTLLTAIYDDDQSTVHELLKEDPSLALGLIDEDVLYEGKIVHWLYEGDSPMHLAAAGYRLEIVGILVRAGADPKSARNRRKATPLHYAADGYISSPTWDPKRQVETIEYLRKVGADLEAQDNNGATALHRAVRTRCADAVETLLRAGCDPATRNKSGSTAFHLAVQNTGRGGTASEEAKAAQRQIISAFRSFGVNPALTDGNGKSVRDCARSEWIGELLSDDIG